MSNKIVLKRFSIFLFLILFSAALLTAGESPALKRYALFIGANDGGNDRIYLRYAESDALAMAEVMQEIGGVDSSDCRVLLNPRGEELTRSISDITRWVNETKADAKRIEFLLYYSGHSDEYGLLLKGENYPYRKLKDELTKVGADVHIAILDSCSSGSFTRLKGGQRQRPFLMDESVDTSGYAFLTSSSENEAAQESDDIEGSFFTHYLLSGLMGAADHTGNSQVSLNEAYSYASEQTLARTEQTLAGAQHPSYDMKLSGSGDLVLTDLRSASAGMDLADEIEGRLFIRDNTGKLIAEINKVPGKPVTIALPPGYYAITLKNESHLEGTAVTIGYNQTQRLTPDLFQTMEGEKTTIRGNTPKEPQTIAAAVPPRKRIPMELSLISNNGDDFIVEGVALGLIDEVHAVEGIQAGMITSLNGYLEGIQLSSLFGDISSGMNGIQLSGIFSSSQQGAEGIQISGVFNDSIGTMSGAQVGGVFSTHSGGGFEGIQISGIFNDHSDGTMDGIQIGGVFNSSQGRQEGMQIGGIFNTADGDFEGMQIAGIGSFQRGTTMNGTQISGILNSAEADIQGSQVSAVYNKSKNLWGVQTGLINIAKDVRGTQVGILNISDTYTKGSPIGLINITRDGIHKFSAWTDSIQNIYTGFQLGTRRTYTIYAIGTEVQTPGEELFLGIGSGIHLEKERFFMEGEFWGKFFLTPDKISSREYWESGHHFVYPGIRILTGFELLPSLSLVAGFSADGWIPDLMTGEYYPKEDTESIQSISLWDWTDIEYVPRWFVGLRF